MPMINLKFHQARSSISPLYSVAYIKYRSLSARSRIDSRKRLIQDTHFFHGLRAMPEKCFISCGIISRSPLTAPLGLDGYKTTPDSLSLADEHNMKLFDTEQKVIDAMIE